MSLPPASDSSLRTYTPTVAPKLFADESKHRTSHPKPTRLQRAKDVISVMERRLKENRKLHERIMNLDYKLDQINNEIENAFVKIENELGATELGRQMSLQEEITAKSPSTAFLSSISWPTHSKLDR
ncbi:hypothetical protein KIN20_010949 [Parelaphostrongylus tenuis]|uniref:Uncharacterized protein n=1 Tax=Parelaphostrongylus tenuis TaxID=148309 RepID=A0AAD5MUQ6_PARTN|nr:hypothetical protein KIN20_010949 [Parelaphostrongylus tenuis]